MKPKKKPQFKAEQLEFPKQQWKEIKYGAAIKNVGLVGSGDRN